MINELIKLMQSQDEGLKKLLELLETQYKMIMKKDVFGLEGLVDKINECGKSIAKEEVERRKIIGQDSIKDIVNNSDNEENTKRQGKQVRKLGIDSVCRQSIFL